MLVQPICCLLAILFFSETSSAVKYRNVVYYADWTTHTKNHNIWHVDWNKITHINYAFANLKPDGSVVLWDPKVDTDTRHPDRGDSIDDPPGYLYGQFGQAFKLKQQHRGTKLGLSIGGWTGSKHFSTVCKTISGRAKFVSTAMTLLSDLGLDFIDIDWEFPVEGGDTGVSHDPNDIKNYLLLLKEFRIAFKSLNFKAELSVASPAGYYIYKHWDFPAICGILDFINVMTYDFAGGWSQYTDHHANLKYDPNHPPVWKGLSIENTVKDYIKMGCPSEKIVLGIPLYGRSFDNTKGLYSSFNKQTAGAYDYKDLPLAGSTESFHENTLSTYTLSNKKFISYDSPKSLAHKLKFIKDKNLGGTMFWESSQDALATSDRSLISMAFKFYTKSQMEFSNNNIAYPNSKYPNVAGSTRPPNPSPTMPVPTPTKPTPTPTKPTPTSMKPVPTATTPLPSSCRCNQGHCMDGMCNNCNYVAGIIKACYKGWSEGQCTSQGSQYHWCG